jgi:hypothetical protein
MTLLEWTWQDWLSLKMHGEEITADGYEDAFLGICHTTDHCSTPLAAKDYGKCIQVLMDRDGMSDEDAVEFFHFNTLGSYVGPGTPHYIEKWEEE